MKDVALGVGLIGAFAMTETQVELFGSKGKTQTAMANQRTRNMHTGYTAGKNSGYRAEGGGLTTKGCEMPEF